ncbi:MAG TPA: hypothetical protein P5079_02355 [Elusimicrobiota bacterium]|nr:hypothetical protein [Elusimicrobiota bacterium]
MKEGLSKSFFLWSRRSAAALFCAVPALSVLAQENSSLPARTIDVRVENVVRLGASGIVVQQRQLYGNKFLEVVWEMIDRNKDGKISKAERKQFPELGKSMYVNFSALRLNWMVQIPEKIEVDLSAWPSRKPKDVEKAPPLPVVLTVSYKYEPTALDLVELMMPNFNAHDISCRFMLDPVFRALRSNLGKIPSDQSVTDMAMTDGVPGSFSVIVHKRVD